MRSSYIADDTRNRDMVSLQRIYQLVGAPWGLHNPIYIDSGYHAQNRS